MHSTMALSISARSAQNDATDRNFGPNTSAAKLTKFVGQGDSVRGIALLVLILICFHLEANVEITLRPSLVVCSKTLFGEVKNIKWKEEMIK